jgi:hypothetical protein
MVENVYLYYFCRYVCLSTSLSLHVYRHCHLFVREVERVVVGLEGWGKDNYV